ncbi:N-acetylneuraminate synthase family protein [Daejeonella lutea]|uniref:N-acetylneuraminate synthase n=1 Tax=Daejeonella lutea TaxID=572036 RepID=A0A1T5FC02_9SPHI|nr:N-acetylneuraminate synthase family protein [Daejeonella lutea]SKB93699.1 N-acetylneuraminate synthase [Daejeonella lutea]
MRFKVIAEIGSVHDGSFGNACKLVESAAACGADIVKFQTHIAEAETLADAPSPAYFKGEPRLDYFKRTAFSKDQWLKIKEVCRNSNVGFLSSPFSLEAVDLLEDIGVDVYKIPSGEVSNLPLLHYVAQTGKPVILSSGMSDWRELDQAVGALSKGGPLSVMQCTSEYPCPPEKVGLNIITEMLAKWNLPVGFSDHTLGDAASFAAAALGATSIEKHFTFSKLMYGSDAANSMEPGDFARFCAGLKSIWRMLESPVDKDDLSALTDMKRIFEKSIVTSRPIKAGDTISQEDLAYKKPGDGIPAAKWQEIIGKKVNKELPVNYKLRIEDLC